MTDEASAQPNDRTIGEPSPSTPTDAMGDAADAAATAALVALPQPAAAAAGEFMSSRYLVYRCLPCSRALCAVYVYCTCCCTEKSAVEQCPGPRHDSAGKAICELCPVRLSKAKGKLYLYPPGRICGACHMKLKRGKATPALPVAAAVSKQSRKRRAASDPGESPEPATLQALTRRVKAPEPVSTSKKQYNTRREEQIMRLLDETHARRIAAEEAAAAAAAAGERGATHSEFTLTFVP
jgi:hypothetical protein